MNNLNRRCFMVSAFALSFRSSSLGQSSAITPDLSKLAGEGGLKAFNRTVSSLSDGGRKGCRLSAAPGDGVAYIQGTEFSNGTIELDLRGQDVQQQSFLGVAFHGIDGTTYDAVYFRPFNFRTDDAARRIRAVQYVSHPANPWQKLRAEHPGKFEQAVNPVPDPNGWFHARVVIAGPKVSVFVADATEPCLAVTRLSERQSGLVGLWVGNNSSGDFANLRLIPA